MEPRTDEQHLSIYEWEALEPEVQRLFQVDSFRVDSHNRRLEIVAYGTVTLEALARLAALTGRDFIEILAIDRTDEIERFRKREAARVPDEGDRLPPPGEDFEQGLLIHVFRGD